MSLRTLAVAALALGSAGASACSETEDDSWANAADDSDTSAVRTATSSSDGTTSSGTLGDATPSAGGMTAEAASSTNGSGGSSFSAGGGEPRQPVAADCPQACPTGANGVSCCARETLPSGRFAMGRSQTDSDACPSEQSCAAAELPAHEASVSAFALDAFEVTVARFRPFVEAFDDFRPARSSGSHPLIDDSGWQTEWGDQLPANRESLEALLACDDAATYRSTASDTEALPINCLTWFEALAFCIYEGGRLPTESEWEYAAAGGSEERLYPWGNDAPTSAHAHFYPGALGPVGSTALGRARWGQFDMAGNVWEWALDWLDPSWYEGAGNPCDNCANIAGGSHRVLRGGAYSFEEVTLRAATRSAEEPAVRRAFIGVRCVRDTEG